MNAKAPNRVRVVHAIFVVTKVQTFAVAGVTTNELCIQNPLSASVHDQHMQPTSNTNDNEGEPMGTTERSARRRPGVMLGAVVVSLALVAGACSKKDNNGSSAGTTKPTTAGTAAGGTTPGTTPSTEPAAKPVAGGKLVVSGEAEVGSPWTPAAMQCDSYCYQRAKSFFDSVAAVGTDLKVHPYLAESITPNAAFTEWTIKVRSGISFTDGTPVNADAVIRNLQETGTSLLISKALVDIAKVPSAADPTKMELKIVKTDDSTFTIYTGKGGDAAQPLAWPGMDQYLTGQWGLVASPKWLDEVKADPTKATMPVGSGPFIVASYTPRDTLVVKRNPNYWQKDAAGVQLPYLDEIDFKVIEDSQVASEALKKGEIDIFSTSSDAVIKDFRSVAKDFPMKEQDKYVETNYLLIDGDKTGPTQDPRVRCALSKAINRQELIDLVGSGLGTPANGVFSPGQEGYLADNGFDPKQDVAGAQKLIDEYKAATGATSVDVKYGHTATALGDQTAELLKGYWAKIGVTTTVEVVPQDKFITNALLGDKNFYIYGWRQHAGIYIDSQNFWWNSSGAAKDGQGISLNFARINDPIVDSNLADARSNPDAAARKTAAENVNKQMAKMCYQIPTSWTLWGTPHNPKVQGLGTAPLPDGSTANDGAGFSGQFWVSTLWIKS